MVKLDFTSHSLQLYVFPSLVFFSLLFTLLNLEVWSEAIEIVVYKEQIEMLYEASCTLDFEFLF